MLALNPRAIAEARACDAERAAGRVRGPFHGIPIVFKDNIDVLGLPTTGGSRGARRPSSPARFANGGRDASWRRGDARQGQPRRVSIRRLRHQLRGGTIGNAYDPSLSTAGSSGGSAIAVATSLVTVAFGTDTCNSLSNPAAFASLATIRTTRGLTSRAGVMPLNPYNDAVGPMAKSVRDVALTLDQVAGADAEDPVTADAARHITGSFAAGLDARCVERRAHRHAAAAIRRHHRRAGNRDDDGHGRAGDRESRRDRRRGERSRDRGASTGRREVSNRASLKAAWVAYLSRGAKAGEHVITLEELLASGKLAPVSARRFETALAPAPTGDALREASRAFHATRESFRDFFVDLMERERLDALLYPANLARPHTHEGGLERYGGEPSTCEESALTGLPQVTVPGGFIGGRYPFGVSFLGRPWTDARMLSLAYAYEQATHHRRPPATAK